MGKFIGLATLASLLAVVIVLCEGTVCLRQYCLYAFRTKGEIATIAKTMANILWVQGEVSRAFLGEDRHKKIAIK